MTGAPQKKIGKIVDSKARLTASFEYIPVEKRKDIA
jgi:hypothetical protein